MDEKPVYTATVNIPSTPGKIMMNVWPGTGVDSWLKPYDGKTPLTAYYDWMAYDAPLTDGEDTTGAEESSADDTTETTVQSTSGAEVTEQSTDTMETTESGTLETAGPGEQLIFRDDQLYTILSKNSGKSLDVYYGNQDNGTNVLQYTYCGYGNQKWYIQKQDNGYYIIKSYATGKVLSVENFSTENGGNVHQWEYVGNDNQEWTLEYTDGYYKFINRHSGLLLDVSGISKEDNANVQQWEDVSQDNQLWQIAALGGGESGSAEETSTQEDTAAESETVTESESSVEEETSGSMVEPSQVTGVTAVYDRESNQVRITWDDNGAVMYKVVRTDGRTGYISLTYSADSSGWTDSRDLVDGQLYYYRVIGYFRDAEGNLVMGDMSDAVAVVVLSQPPAKVTNVQASVSNGTVVLTWDAAAGVRYYKAARASGATGKYYSLKYNITDTSYTDTGISSGTYRYKVAGYYKDTDGSWVYGDMCDTLYVTVK